jgi:hypothetical protein
MLWTLQLHTAEINDGYDWGRLNLQSVTEESSFQEFMSTAELAGTDFKAWWFLSDCKYLLIDILSDYSPRKWTWALWRIIRDSLAFLTEPKRKRNIWRTKIFWKFLGGKNHCTTKQEILNLTLLQTKMGCLDHSRRTAGDGKIVLPHLATRHVQTAGGRRFGDDALREKSRVLEAAVESGREEVRINLSK